MPVRPPCQPSEGPSLPASVLALLQELEGCNQRRATSILYELEMSDERPLERAEVWAPLFRALNRFDVVMKAADLLLEYRYQKDPTPDVAIVDVALKQLLRLGSPSSVINLFHRAKKVGIVPSVDTYVTNKRTTL